MCGVVGIVHGKNSARSSASKDEAVAATKSFSAQLALKMSLAKMKYLNRARIKNHGVHPDVPKNVSKSITVD